jgi:Ca-activated chloride channel homolog
MTRLMGIDPNGVRTFDKNTREVQSLALPSTEYSRSLPERRVVTDTALVLDISGSMGHDDYVPTRLAAARDAAVEFLKHRLGSDPEGRVGVVAFNETGRQVCELTPLAQAFRVEDAICSIYGACGGTDIGAGLLAAEQCFIQGQAILPSYPHYVLVRRQVVLLSDGCNQSQVSTDPRWVADRLKAAGCEIHTVGIGAPQNVDEALLRAIASRDDDGNSLYRFIDDRGGLMRHFGDIGGLTR